MEASTSSTKDKTSEFSKELCEMMVSVDILLNKVNNSHFKTFLEKYTNKTVPTESTLRKIYLSSCYEDSLKRIRDSVADNKIWVSIDETTDIEGRYITHVIIGTHHADRPGDTFLLTSNFLQQANHSMVAILFNDAMKILWGDKFKRDNVLLFITDAAPYMVKAAKGINIFNPKLVHVTCLAHALHRAAEEIHGNFPDVDKLISNIKKIFIKAPRIETFKQLTPSTHLPPQPVLTRWGTWLDAAMYYCENYSIIKDIVNTFNRNNASSIKIVQELFSNSLSGNLAYIKSNFGCISSSITSLEAVDLEMCESLKIVKDVELQLGKACGKVADNVKNKLQNVLRQNNGYATLCKIRDVLSGEVTTGGCSIVEM